MFSPASEPVLPMVSTMGPWAPSSAFASTAIGSGGFSANNVAIYHPIVVPVTCVVRRAWWANGATVSASYNVDCGIYADGGHKPGARLVSSGSTAQGTANEIQFVNVTDTVLAPGVYWVGLACSSNSATFFRRTGAASYDALFRLYETSAMPLPATATPAEPSDSQYASFLCGFATTASP